MGKILLINPVDGERKTVTITKSGVKKMAKARRTPAQIRATKKLVAFNRARGRMSNPLTPRGKKRAKKNKTHHVAGYYPNPISPARTYKKRRAISHAHSPIRRRKHNPIGGSIVRTYVAPVITAATGALALDVLWSHLPIPANLKIGNMQYAAKGLGAILLSTLAGKLVSKSTANAMGVGALTVIAHTAAKEMLTKMVPTLNLGDYSDYAPYMGEYVHAPPMLGEYTSAMTGPAAMMNMLRPAPVGQVVTY